MDKLKRDNKEKKKEFDKKLLDKQTEINNIMGELQSTRSELERANQQSKNKQ